MSMAKQPAATDGGQKSTVIEYIQDDRLIKAEKAAGARRTAGSEQCCY